MLFLSFREEVTESIDIAAEARRKLPSNSTSFGDDRIVFYVHGVINSSGVHTIGGS